MAKVMQYQNGKWVELINIPDWSGQWEEILLPNGDILRCVDKTWTLITVEGDDLS